jgi:hypothetical protein
LLDGAKLLEEGGAEVEDEVDTSPLLHHLERYAQEGTAQLEDGFEKPPVKQLAQVLK